MVVFIDVSKRFRLLLVVVMAMLLVPGMVLSQPGPSGGTLRVRVFDDHGRIITPENKYFQVYLDTVGIHQDSNVEHSFKLNWGNKEGVWYWDSYPTPMGGMCPGDIDLIITDCMDTMRVLLTCPAYGLLKIDSIPFLPGVYEPDMLMINFKCFNGSFIKNHGWDSYKINEEELAKFHKIKRQFEKEKSEYVPSFSASRYSRLLDFIFPRQKRQMVSATCQIPFSCYNAKCYNPLHIRLVSFEINNVHVAPWSHVLYNPQNPELASSAKAYPIAAF